MAADVEKLLNEFNVGKEMEDEIGEEGIGRDYAGWLARTIHRVDQMKLLSSNEAGFESLFFWDDDYDMVFSGTFVEGIRGLAGGTAALMGYGYEDVKGIFVDIGLNLPLMLVGTESAFDMVGSITQKKMADALRNMPPIDEFTERQEVQDIDEEHLPFH